MVRTNTGFTIRTNIETKDVHAISLTEWSRRYRANNKTRIFVHTVLEVEIGLKVTALGRRRTFAVAKFDFGGGDMNVATINISSVNLHNPEPLRTATCGGGKEGYAAATTTTTGDTTIADPVSVQVLRRQHHTL